MLLLTAREAREDWEDREDREEDREDQEALNAQETLEAKLSFERLSMSFGVKVKKYRVDNGMLTYSTFQDSCKFNGQEITFCGVGAHHQNGIVERANRYI